MPERKYNLHDGITGAAITVRIIPRAIRNEINEILDDGTVKVHLTALQTGEKANSALIQFLADVLKVKTNQIEIVAGLEGNDKLVTIMNLDKETVQERILKNLA